MNYIPIATFSNYMDAHIIMGRLCGENIECWLQNENTTTIIPAWTSIQLMVHKDHLHKALYLLNQFNEEKHTSHSSSSLQ